MTGARLQPHEDHRLERTEIICTGGRHAMISARLFGRGPGTFPACGLDWSIGIVEMLIG